MSESYISSVTVRERRFLGGTSVYTSDSQSVVYPNSFDFDVNISLQNPQPEISKLNCTIVGVEGIDNQGIIYSGNFQVKRNLLNNTPSITISGDNVSLSELEIIKNSISLSEVVDDATHTNNLAINMNLLQLNAYGLDNFTITVPVEDASLTLSDAASVIPFFTLDATNANPSYDNPISITVGNNQLIIDAGSIIRTIPSLTLTKNWATTRNITAATVDYDPSNSTNITVAYSEDLSGVEGLRFRGTNVPTLNVPNVANYCLQISTRLYNHAASLTVDPARYDDASTTRRLAYRIQYGVGKLVNGVLQSAKLFDYGVHASNSCTAVFDTSKCVITCNDFTTITRHALTIRNYTNKIIPSVRLNIDKSNSANNYFIVTEPLFGGFAYYSGFSNDMYLTDFVANVKQVMDGFATLRWETGVARGMPITINSPYEYAKISDIPSFETLQFSPSLYNTINLYSVPEKARTVFTETFTYASDGNTLQDFRTWFLLKFGSYGANFTWAIPDTDEFNALAVNPIIVNSGTVTHNINYTSNNIGSAYSITNCYLDVNATSSIYDEANSVDTVIKFNTSTYPTISSVADYIESRLNEIISDYYPTGTNIPDTLNIQVDVANPIYSNYESQNYLFYEEASNSYIQSFTYHSTAYTSYNAVSTTRSTGISLNSSFSRIDMSNIKSSTISIPITSNDSLGNLVNYINSTSNDIINIVIATLTDSNYSNFAQSTLQAIDNYDLLNNASLTFNSRARLPFITRYNLANYATLTALKNQVDADYTNDIVFTIDDITNNFIDAKPINLQEITIGDIKTTAGTFYGTVRDVADSFSPSFNLTFNYSIEFANTTGLDPHSSSGLQVALGGYEKDGVFYSYDAPNAFFEPTYNTLFPIEFSTTEADVVYLLLRTRKQINGSDTYVVNPTCYTGLAKYANGYKTQNLVAYTPSEATSLDAWTEDFGIPVVMPISLYSSKTEVSIEDVCTLESINVSIINKPAAFDQFGFLAINKTNAKFSQTESKVGTVYGLVLDNRGAWDVLISPEAILHSSNSGSILYGSNSYSREILDDDEGYDMVISSLDSAFTSYVKIAPVPNSPQVWALQVDPNVKRILRSRKTADPTSSNGCSVDVDITITGRTSRITGTARVTIFYDYTCVYDIGLCDFYWNLIDPPQTKKNQVIQNKLGVAFETLIDCSAINEQSDDNLEMKMPVLVSLSNIPTFENGNALLLIKSGYTSTVQNFYFPVSTELDALQRSDCSPISSNIPLISRVNKEFLLLPNIDTPITDSYLISTKLLTETSYLYVRPQFRFPPDDNVKDCDPNEIVIAGIGYQFKNWKNGYRNDDIVLGLNLVFSTGIYTSPSLNICCRYYFNQNET
jgi:hypothetical protein